MRVLLCAVELFPDASLSSELSLIILKILELLTIFRHRNETKRTFGYDVVEKKLDATGEICAHSFKDFSGFFSGFFVYADLNSSLHQGIILQMYVHCK